MVKLPVVEKMQGLDPWLAALGPREAFESLANLLPEAGVFAVDQDRRIVYWNDGAQRLLGFTAKQVVGEHCLKANRCQTCMVGCGIADRKVIQNVPLTLFNEAGQPIPVSKSGRAFFNRSGKFAGGVEVLVPRIAAAKSPPKLPVIQQKNTPAFHELKSRDPAMQRVFQVIRNVAETETTVLIRGESGTGKELIARAIHSESKRAKQPFIGVNCAALTPSLVESELFGHVRGAFTGAAGDRKGVFQQAHRGTLFLDEVAELPLDAQAKLLRVLEEREVLPVGATKTIKLDVRVVSATHRSLKDYVKRGKFREDLLYRLRVVPIVLPPLRERPRDIELLLWHFVSLGNQRGPRRVTQISPDAMRALLLYSWPGNIRELRNCLEYVFAVGRGESVQLADLPAELSSSPSPQAIASRSPPPTDGERTRLAHTLETTGGHLGKTALLLGISRPTLWRKRKKYGL